MSKSVGITRIFPLNRNELFKYFMTPELLEQWSYPDGLTLKIPFLEFKKDGRYRYEHSSTQGVFRCDGHFTDFIQNKKLEMIDDLISGPDGKPLHKNLKCTINFREVDKGTEVEVIQEGFKDDKSVNECRQSWEQCFDHLSVLIDQMLGPQLTI